jgi:hypothetical protein
MSDKLKIWDEKAQKLAESHPLKTARHLPNMPGITPETARHLKWKSLKYLLRHDKNRVIPRYFFKHPLKYGLALLKSARKKKSYTRDGDFFLYGIPSTKAFQDLLEKPDSLFVIGFSYCHKPYECPSGRFTEHCQNTPDHPVCGQCFIGKVQQILPENAIPLFIPTIHYIGEKIFELTDKYPDKQLVFLITACELTLEMFGDWGNMVGALGIGVRLDGRICNTMKAFELSEHGIKPGLTVVLDETQERILQLLRKGLG